MAVVEIPMSNEDPAFTFSTDLDGVTFNFEFRWNGRTQLWVFDLLDSLGASVQLGNPFFSGFPFLRQNVGANIPAGQLLASNSDSPNVDADRFTIGTIVKLFYIEEGTEIEEVVDAEGAT